MNEHAEPLALKVVGRRHLAPEIVELTLADPGGATLPGWEAGAHIKLQVTLDGVQEWRHYSLINFDATPQATAAPREYRIAIRRADAGRGGSRWIHETVCEGDTLQIEPPSNQFALGDGEVMLLAGGIGVTPLISMAAALKAAHRNCALHYCGRSRAQMAYLDALSDLCAANLHVYPDDVAAQRLELGRLIASIGATQTLYVCGPKGMLDAVLELTRRAGWPQGRVRFELFDQAQAQAADRPFKVELKASGMTLDVPPDRTVLDVMLEAKLDPLYDCKRGECGLCRVGVLDGEIDHRDYCLTDAEKKAGDVMHICVSRGRSGLLVLDA